MVHRNLCFAAFILQLGCGISDEQYQSVVAERDSLLDPTGSLWALSDSLQLELDSAATLLTIYRSEMGIDTTLFSGSNDPLMEEYVQLLDIQVLAAEYINTYSHGTIPGLRFQITNNGSRVVSELTVTAFFKDQAGSTIGEEAFRLVTSSGFDASGPLRPGYSVYAPSDREQYYTASQITDEWQEGNIEVQVTEMEFE
jgi:hypothetical protein